MNTLTLYLLALLPALLILAGLIALRWRRRAREQARRAEAAQQQQRLQAEARQRAAEEARRQAEAAQRAAQAQAQAQAEREAQAAALEAERQARAAQAAAEAEAAAAAAAAVAAAQAAEAQASAAATPAPVPAQPPLVMVADDSKVVRVKTSRLLAQHGWRVVLAEDGAQAAALIEQEVPLVLVTDVEMPGLDGFALTRHVRAHPRARDITIIMITSADDRLKAAAEEAGVTLVLGKPYPEEALLAGLQRAQAGLGANAPH